MTDRSRSLTDRLLVRAWVEPDHELPLRVMVRHQRPEDQREEQLPFLDADQAGAFVTAWLRGLVDRWERGERSPGPPVPRREWWEQQRRD